MAQIKQQEIILQGVLVRYFVADENNAAAPAVIFLPGWQSKAQNWHGALQSLLDLRLPLFALDFPGFGVSQSPLSNWNLDSYVALVEEFIQKMKITQVILVGHSFGGRVAIKIAAKKPVFLKKLVLVDSAGKPQPFRSKLFLNGIAKIVKPFFAPRFMQPLRRKIYQKMGAEDYVSSAELKHVFVHVINEDLLPLLPTISVPTLLVWGAKDQDTPLSLGKLMAEKIPNSRLVVFESAHHFSFLDEPVRFAHELKTFLV